MTKSPDDTCSLDFTKVEFLSDIYLFVEKNPAVSCLSPSSFAAISP